MVFLTFQIPLFVEGDGQIIVFGKPKTDLGFSGLDRLSDGARKRMTFRLVDSREAASRHTPSHGLYIMEPEISLKSRCNSDRISSTTHGDEREAFVDCCKAADVKSTRTPWLRIISKLEAESGSKLLSAEEVARESRQQTRRGSSLT